VSIRLMSDVWRLDLPTVEKMVLLVIPDHANDEGTQSYPSQATIALKASVSIRTVQRAVNTLCAQGYVRMTKHAGGSADCREDRRPHLYQINLNALRGDTVTRRTSDANGATMTTDTGRQSRPMNHPLEPSIEPPSFDVFWKIYPRKVGKQAAQKAFIKALKVAQLEEILAGAERYANDPNRVDAFTAHPTTWLNAGRWADPALPERVKTADEKRAEELRLSKERNEREAEERLRWQQDLEEAKKKEVQKIQTKTGKLSKKQVMKVLDYQGGIGAKAVQKYIDKNPDRGPRQYKLGDKM